MVEIVEVSPRDGLQNEPVTLSTADKLSLVDRAIAAGARRIEVASFVNPARVPQMADAEAVIAGLPRDASARFIGLVLNARGVGRALASGIGELGFVAPASDAFAVANQGMDRAACALMVEDGIERARSEGRRAQATIAVAFGCPFAGAVDPALAVDLARRFAAAGAVEVAVADTIGVARPREVAALTRAIAAAIAPLPVRVHLHDTRGMGIANALAAQAAGAATLDAAIGGTGGCPFAPGAAGNIATEELAFALGDEAGLDLAQLLDAAAWLNARLGRERRSMLLRAERG